MLEDGNIIIDEEFRDLLPPLTAETYEELEKSIISEGCRDSIVLWGGVIVDGHNRYAICLKHDVLSQTTEKNFASRDTAKIWIISTQIARRQLTPKEQSYYRGMQYNLEKQLWGGDRKSSGHNDHLKPKENESVKTAQRLADQYNVSEKTIRRDGEMADAIKKIGDVSSSAKKQILSGKSGIGKKELEKLVKASDEEISTIAEQIESGTYTKKKRMMPAGLPGSEPEPVREKEIHIPKGWEMPVPMPAKKQTWCAYISAGIETLTGVIGIIEDDFRDKLPLVETKAERDYIRDSILSHIDRLLEIIKRI